MTGRANQINSRNFLGAWIGLLSGIWGVALALAFAAPIIRALVSGLPISIWLAGEGKGFLFIVLHLVAFSMLAVIGGAALRGRGIEPHWALRFIAMSLLFIALSLIPASSIGFLMLPAAIGMLASGWLFKAN